jgi:hypothetical protein
LASRPERTEKRRAELPSRERIKAKQSKAKSQSKAKQSKSNQSKAKQSKANQSKAKQHKAKQRYVIVVIKTAAAGDSFVRRVRRQAQEGRDVQDVFGLRVRGVLLRRVPGGGLARS